jgi:hypothetical protein
VADRRETFRPVATRAAPGSGFADTFAEPRMRVPIARFGSSSYIRREVVRAYTGVHHVASRRSNLS